MGYHTTTRIRSKEMGKREKRRFKEREQNNSNWGGLWDCNDDDLRALKEGGTVTPLFYSLSLFCLPFHALSLACPLPFAFHPLSETNTHALTSNFYFGKATL